MDKTIEIPKLTILTEEQVYGPNKLNIFNIIDPRAAVSDTAILRGAYVSGNHVNYDNTFSGRTGYYWLQNLNRHGGIRGVYHKGDCVSYWPVDRYIGIRVALPYSQIKNLPHTIKTRSDGLEEITYGYLPGTSISKSNQKKLSSAYNSKTLKRIGIGCTFNGRKIDDYGKNFLPEEQVYFEYNGEIYTSIRANSHYSHFILSNDEEYEYGDYVWVEVEPVVWLKHPLDDIMISEKEIIAGVEFYKTQDEYGSDFNTTELKWFLDNHLSKDILSLYELKKYINKNNYSDDEIKTINNFIYLNENGNPIKKKKIIVKAKRKSNS